MLFRIFVIFATTQIVSATVKDCNTSTAFRPVNIAVSPEPPIPNELFQLSFIFNNTGTIIENGNVNIDIDANGLPYSIIDSLCSYLSCPIVNGINDFTHDSTWPDITGKITTKIVITDDNSYQLLCIIIIEKVPSSWSNPIFSIIRSSYKHLTDKKHLLRRPF